MQRMQAHFNHFQVRIRRFTCCLNMDFRSFDNWFKQLYARIVVYRFYCMALYHSQTRRHIMRNSILELLMKIVLLKKMLLLFIFFFFLFFLRKSFKKKTQQTTKTCKLSSRKRGKLNLGIVHTTFSRNCY